MFRVSKLNEDYFILVELETDTLDISIRLTDSFFREVKIMEGIPPSVLRDFGAVQCSMLEWIEGTVDEFPIEIDAEAIKLYDNLSQDPSELDTDSIQDPSYDL